MGDRDARSQHTLATRLIPGLSVLAGVECLRRPNSCETGAPPPFQGYPSGHWRPSRRRASPAPSMGPGQDGCTPAGVRARACLTMQAPDWRSRSAPARSGRLPRCFAPGARSPRSGGYSFYPGVRKVPTYPTIKRMIDLGSTFDAWSSCAERVGAAPNASFHDYGLPAQFSGRGH